jgi:hypothetical protein
METPEKTYVDALQQEHADIFRNLQKLDESLAPVSPTELCSRLGEVRGQVTDHFRFEEEGGYMAPLLKEEPRFGAQVADLLAEHRQMSDTLDAIIRDLQAASGSEVPCDRVRAWMKQMRHHESKENSLVQEAYYTTGATGD